jgi:hypothetical protein
MGSFNANSIYKGAVGGPEVAEKALRRGNFQDAVVTREKTVLRQAELCIFAPPDHEGVVLVKCEVAPGLRPGHDV